MIMFIGYIFMVLWGVFCMGKVFWVCFLLLNGVGIGVMVWNGVGLLERYVVIIVLGFRVVVFVGCGEMKGSVGNSVVLKWRCN